MTDDEARRERAVNDWRAVLGAREGRRVLADLLRHAGLFRPSGGGETSHVTAYHEGQRSIALTIHETARDADPIAHAALLAELMNPTE